MIRQCRSKHWFGEERCQGASGHSGMHWSYDEGGWLNQWHNRREPYQVSGGHKIASSHTPPGHKSYVSPEKKIDEHYRTLRHLEQKKDK